MKAPVVKAPVVKAPVVKAPVVKAPVVKAPGSAGLAAREDQRAKTICASCPVRQPCLMSALATGQEFGIWGGYDEGERGLLHRRWRESRPVS